MIIIKCVICNKTFNKRLLWQSLFLTDERIRCPKCDELYRVDLNVKFYELENGVIDCYRLFNKSYKVKAYGFIFELGELYKMLIKKYGNETLILYFDSTFQIIDNIKYLNEALRLSDKLVIITLY